MRIRLPPLSRCAAVQQPRPTLPSVPALPGCASYAQRAHPRAGSRAAALGVRAKPSRCCLTQWGLPAVAAVSSYISVLLPRCGDILQALGMGRGRAARSVATPTARLTAKARLSAHHHLLAHPHACGGSGAQKQTHTVAVWPPRHRSRLLHRQPGGHHAANHALHPIGLDVRNLHGVASGEVRVEPRRNGHPAAGLVVTGRS